MLKIDILPVALILLTVTNDGNTKDRKCSGKVNASAASGCCQLTKTKLYRLKSTKDNQNIWEILVISNITTAWVELKRVRFRNWTWTDGNISDALVKNSSTVNSCAFYNMTSKTFNAEKCSSMTYGHLCLKKGCSDCFPTGVHRHVCERHGSNCITYHCVHKNWFAAAAACRAWNASLAVMKDDTITSQLRGSHICETFWIGLRKMDWTTDNITYISDTPVSFFKEDEPAITGDCLVVQATANSYYWRAESCSADHNFLCQNSSEGIVNLSSTQTGSPMTPQITTEYTDNPFPPKMIILVVTGSILFVLLFGLTTLLILRWKKTAFSRGSDRRTSAHEKKPLMDKEEDGPLQIVTYDDETSRFSFYMKNLQRILLRPEANDPSSPLVVISIAGPYRTGKSFMLNLLLSYLVHQETGDGRDWLKDTKKTLRGFLCASGPDVVTYGIWIWSRPIQIKYPSGKQVTLLLVDTQGLADPRKEFEATSMATLSSLLSSMQIYNTMLDFDENDKRELELIINSRRLILQSDTREEEGRHKNLMVLIRDRKESKEFPTGFAGGGSYMKGMGNPMGAGHISCFLMPHPGPAVDGYMNTCIELQDVSSTFRVKLEEFVNIYFDEHNVKELSFAGIPASGVEFMATFIKCVSIYNTGDLPKPSRDFEALEKAMNEIVIDNGMKEFYSALHQCLPMGSREKTELFIISQSRKSKENVYKKLRGTDETKSMYQQKFEDRLAPALPHMLYHRTNTKTDFTNVLLASKRYAEKMQQELCSGDEMTMEKLEQLHERHSEEAMNCITIKEHIALLENIIAQHFSTYNTIVKSNQKRY